MFLSMELLQLPGFSLLPQKKQTTPNVDALLPNSVQHS
jgi:hypothetical protein